MRIRFAIRIAAVALSITPAVAADYGRFPPAPFYAPRPALRVYSWTGCYLGGQLGGAFADNHFDGDLLGFEVNNNDGAAAAIIGGQVGCDLQVARNWVIGAQIDGAWTHLNGSQTITGTASLPNQGSNTVSGNLITNANVLATATGRIGYAVNYDSIAGLFYVKGGAAFVNDDRYNFNGQSTTITCLIFDPMSGCKTFSTPSSAAVNFTAPSANRFGWTIGLGTEWAVFDHWSVFGEWDYMNFGTHTVTLTDAFFGSTQLSAKQQVNVLKLGINYRFGNSLPEH